MVSVDVQHSFSVFLQYRPEQHDEKGLQLTRGDLKQWTHYQTGILTIRHFIDLELAIDPPPPQGEFCTL